MKNVNIIKELNVIGLDTTTSTFSIGLVRGKKELGRIVVDEEGYHTEEFLLFLEKILEDNGMKEENVDGYAISAGPGSLTGIRVGFSFLMGIGFVTGKPVIPVRTLYAIAYPLRHSGKPVCPILETRKGKVFCALYDFGSKNLDTLKKMKGARKGDWKILIEQSCMEIDELLKKIPDREILFTGRGAFRYRDLLKKIVGVKASIEQESVTHPDPISVASVGLEKIKKGEIPSIQEIEPIYL